MKEFLIGLIGSATGPAAYGLVFLVLLAAGFGLPLPEDIPLIMGGVLVHRGQANLAAMIAVGYLGIIIGDSIIFHLGRRFGSKVGAKPGFLARIATPEKRAKVEGLFKKHGEKIVIVARFLPGVRAVTYFTAGSVGMSYPRFALYDSLAALASAPIFVILGNYFGGDIEELFKRIAAGEKKVIAVLVVLVLGALLFRLWRTKREKKAAERLALEQAMSEPSTNEQTTKAEALGPQHTTSQP